MGTWPEADRILSQMAGIALLVALCLAAVMILRWTGLSRPEAKDTQPASRLTWILICYAIGAAGVAGWSKSSFLGGSGAAAVGVFLVLIVVVPGLALAGIYLARKDWALARLIRRAGRGEIDATLVELQRVLDQRPMPDSPPDSTGADNPWAPPRGRPRRNKWRGDRHNLMGSLRAHREEWPEARDCFEEADRVAGPEPIYRSNWGAMLIKLDRSREGLDLIRSAVADVPKYRPVDRYRMAMVLASNLHALGRRSETEAALDQADAALRSAWFLPPTTRKRLAREVRTLRHQLSPSLARSTPT